VCADVDRTHNQEDVSEDRGRVHPEWNCGHIIAAGSRGKKSPSALSSSATNIRILTFLYSGAPLSDVRFLATRVRQH
jgi:hypothetical protein